MDSATFIKEIVVNILGKNLSSNKNAKQYGGSYNTVKQSYLRNNKIGIKVATIISNMIIKELFEFKKEEAIKYLKGFLNNEEVKEFKNMKYENENIKKLVFCVVEKLNKSKFKTKTENYKIVGIPELIEMGWSIRDYVKKSTMLSYEVYDEELTEEHVTELEKSIKVVSEQPDNRRILLDENNEMIGMWSFKPFYIKAFEKAKKGELFDSEITPSMMPTLIPGGIYNIYFSNIVLKKRYRNTTAFIILLFSIIELIKKWADEDIFINEICTQAYSDNGKNLCKVIGLDFVKEHIDHGDIYCAKVVDLVNKPFCNRFDDIEELRDLYKEFKKNERNYQLI